MPGTAASKGVISEQKQEALAGLDQVQRLDAKGIAGGQELTGLSVHHHEGIHALEPLERSGAPDLQGVDQNFGVAFGAEDDPRLLQLLAQLGVIVDFTIE